ncbi:YcxB family protein [Flavitalea sp. BT771]|uniref:YcxB family protein n=1 Tax=Flavitalea sp. BT771 TaxID=3063329 RepID=UPI0026E32F39|nr:YcxB family protein [Flavitalea sp. BT771]MDO6435705.1 YcxB family protein [Flavitalea sp. BT771]MDV6224606.1 YcxB family protein [Flavitalea sp. BT771]
MAQRETYTLHQTLKLSEILLGAYYIASRTKIIKVVFFFVLIIGVLRESLALALATQSSIKWYIVIFDTIAGPLFIFLFFFVFISLGVILLTVIRPGNYRDLTYRFTHWGMEKSGKNIDFTRPWSKFLRLRESKHFLFLYISENDAHFFHKKAFVNDQEIEDFKQFVSRQIGQA